MARRRLISDEDLFEKFEEYVINECSNDISLFKLPKFDDYLRTRFSRSYRHYLEA